MSTTFTNPNRTRYYGLRPGDIVTLMFSGDKNEEYIVKDLTPLDNNSVVLESTSTGNVIEFVAEYCKIVKEVSDEPTN